MSKKLIEEITQKLAENLPEEIKQTHRDIEAQVKLAIEMGLNKFNLVTREEFDIQQKILLKTREKLDALEKKVETLEQTLGHK